MDRQLALTLACADYELTRPIIEGRIEPDGVDLTVLTDDHDRLYRLHRRDEVDIAEFNITEYFRAREYGHKIIGLPIFPHRRFRHGYIFINTQKGIEQPTDLLGRAVGIVGRAPAAGVWARGILQEFFDVPFEKVDWRENPIEPFDGPDYGKMTFEDRIGQENLFRGEIDALISPGVPQGIHRGDPRIGRLFPNWKELEISYYRETSILPIMHVLTVREELLHQHPWLAASISAAFQKAKQFAYNRSWGYRAAPIALIEHVLEQQKELLGDDPWAYGLGPTNRNNIEAAFRYTKWQGRVTGELNFDEAFFPVDETIFAS